MSSEIYTAGRIVPITTRSCLTPLRGKIQGASNNTEDLVVQGIQGKTEVGVEYVGI